MSRSRIVASLLFLASSSCAELERIPRLFDDRTPRERYEAGLEQAGLGATALVRDWTVAGNRALREAPAVTSPYAEDGYLPPAEPAALAFRVSARRGQAISFELRLSADSTALIFLDAWQVGQDSASNFEPIAEADSGQRSLTVEPRRDGDFIFRAQPELLRGGRFTVVLRVGPTLDFPVRGKGEKDIRSGFAAPRDGGTRLHHGIDIFAPRGTPALAAAEAVVRRVEVTPRGGNVVWLRDARGNSLYYAHLDRQAVEEGMRVRPGDTVGFVGNTGNAVTTPPHLHFGIYRRGEGPIDPKWFVHPVRGEPPRLVADTVLLGAWARTRSEGAELRAVPDRSAEPLLTLPRHTALRVLAAVGAWYRVRLPDGSTGYLAARRVEPTEPALSRRVGAGSIRPRPIPAGGEVIVDMSAGDSVEVLGHFGEYLLVRTPTGLSGWLAH